MHSYSLILAKSFMSDRQLMQWRKKSAIVWCNLSKYNLTKEMIF